MFKQKGRGICTLLLLAALTGCTNTRHEASAPQYINSSAITFKIKQDLLRDPIIRSHPISVSTYQDTVTLSGKVKNEIQEERAIEIARSVRGVKYVVDNLTISKS